MTMRLVDVGTPALEQAWIRMPVPLYRHDAAYIQPLDADIRAVFDPAKNERMRHGAARRWLLQDGAGAYIGRIAAFYENERLADQPLAVGGMGFFECIDDVAAAQMLLQAAEAWLIAAGINAIDGPINFGARDRWWGCLADGFRPPLHGAAYNLPYYPALLEACGYQVYFKQFTYNRPMFKPLHPVIVAKAERLYADPAYSFRNIKQQEIDAFAEYFRVCYNRAWGKHAGVHEMTPAQAKEIVRELKPIIDPRLLWFGFYNGEPVAFFIMLPELNQLFKRFKGKPSLWHKLWLLYRLKFKPVDVAFGVVYGVVPEHQGKGVESALIVAASKLMQKPGATPYQRLEMNWIGDFNPKMMKLAEMMGGELYKTHHTYRKILDPAIPFERCPVIK